MKDDVKGLSSQKQKEITGGNVNYYLIDVAKTANPYVAEVEDIIETLNMNFAEGTVLKSLVRLCKLKQNFGKPGSSELYEAQKINYYGERIFVQSQLQSNKTIITEENTNYYLISVQNPKRAKPYVADIEDIIKALDMNYNEETLFKNLIKLCKRKLESWVSADVESTNSPQGVSPEAQEIKAYANKILICHTKTF